jgi:hypothetical protein
VALYVSSSFCAPCVAETSCAACDDPEYPETIRILTQQGYDPDTYEFLLSWREAVKADLNFVVTGYHLRRKSTGETIDLYADDAGRFLSGFELALLEIRPKNWNPAPMEQGPKAASVATPVEPAPEPIGPKLAEKTAPGAVELPALNVDELLAQDETRPPYSHAKGPRRIGVVRRLSTPIRASSADAGLGRWTMMGDGGWLWSATIRSHEARAIRVHFTDVHLPEQARLTIYDAADPHEAYAVDFSEPDFWSLSCFSDAVVVELYLPANSATDGMGLAIDELAHTYADVSSAYSGKAAVIEGRCHNDVACYEEWHDVSLAVAGYNNVTSYDQVYCTGTLLADCSLSDENPLFITANHCMEKLGGASSLEFYWFFQKTQCDNTPPPPVEDTVRTSGGAYILSRGNDTSATDYALLKLKNPPPAAAYFAGWSSSPVPVDTPVADIHHPQGTYKRISFGDSILRPTTAHSAARFHAILWNSGTTEPASSGSPLFLEDSQLLVGQLWGGGASCYSMDAADYFGRFDVTLKVIEQWLMPEDPFDLDGSGLVDAADLQLAVKSVLLMPVQTYADIDHSGVVDAVDVQHLVLAVKARGTI